MTSSKRACAAASVALAFLAGCGGALPLGHPAHVLSLGKSTLAAGVAGTVLATTSANDDDAVRLQDLAVAPTLSPWVAARAGLGEGFEGGLGASARAIRVDARRAFSSSRLALSIGLGASALLAARPEGGDASGVYGGGFDVPVLLGWRSSADLYAAWIGPRVGADIFSGQLDAGGAADPIAASGRHLRFGGVAGLRAGFRRVHAVVEVEAAYHQADGTLGAKQVSLSAFSVAPAGALVVSF